MPELLQKEDVIFDRNYPLEIRKISSMHWTPITIVKESADWLTSKRALSVLDIGSGVGKFCLYGSIISNLRFTGIEIRPNLVGISKKTAIKLGLGHAKFYDGNVTQITFDDYDSAYFYNPFCEQEAISNQIDDSVRIGKDILTTYEVHVFQQLEKAPIGFLFITYRSPHFQPPSSFRAGEILHDGELVFWEKVQ